ncbi:MAG: hypothetical protein Q9219_004431 [cf. Caloplaca sp. 3 TL-2023]
MSNASMNSRAATSSRLSLVSTQREEQEIQLTYVARNVVLLTLIMDTQLYSSSKSIQNGTIWRLFYNMLISADDLEILKKHTTKLVATTESIEAWLASPHGPLLQFMDRQTLCSLRQYWTQYQTFDVMGKAATELRDGVRKRGKEVAQSLMFNGLRSAGAVWPYALDTAGLLYRRYWETGVAGGSSQDCKELGRGVPNPMFAISSAPSGFAVHYGTEPLVGFHLPETFRSLDKRSPPTTQSDTLVEAAKRQFNDWCRTFGDAVRAHRVRIRLFYGGAMEFCHELQLEIALGRRAAHASTYSRPWSAEPMRFDSHMGSKDLNQAFDVVDTSNLGDHVGLINMITTTAPLLRSQPSSVLYIESLLAASDDLTTALPDALGSDVPTFSILMGLRPAGLVSGVTFEAVSNEAMLQTISGSEKMAVLQRQYYLRSHWKASDPASPPKIDPDQLAAWFLEVYKKMFAHEDVSSLFSRMQRMQITHFSTDRSRYTRAALVALMRVVKTRIVTNWEKVMDKFLDLVESDRSLLVGSNSLQELNVHLALYGVWTLPVLEQSPRQIQNRFHLDLRSPTNERGILGQVNPPPIVHVVLSVPRKSLKVFTDSDVDRMGTPGLHMSVKQRFGVSQYENCFFSLHCSFGRLRVNDQAGCPAIFEEDGQGWRGSADLFVACTVPTFGLLMGPRDGLQVSLVINTTPENIMFFKPKLGLHLVVYETALENAQRVSILRDPPLLDTKSSTTSQREWLQALSREQGPEEVPLATFDANHRIHKMQIRTVLEPKSETGKALASGEPVTVNAVNLFTFQLNIGNTPSRDVAFPYPVQSNNAITRVARKSSWVEIVAALHAASRKDPFDTWTKVRYMSNASLALEYVPRVNLDIQPIINNVKQEDSTWLNILTTAGTMSVIEKEVVEQRKASSNTPGNAKIELKQSLSMIFSSFMGFHPETKTSIRTFQLTHQQTKSAWALIFAKSLRHDLDLGSVVLDAYVLPLTKARLQIFGSAIQRLFTVESKPPLGINLQDDECILWKRLLPALAERCRTWQHKGTCEYRTKGEIPLSIDVNENPLCGCGEGQIPSDFAQQNRELAPVAKYVTRIAIAFIFPVPYLEATAVPTDLADKEAGAQPALDSRPKCDSCKKTSGQLSKCAACGTARYCSKECQKSAWKSHKVHCKR